MREMILFLIGTQQVYQIPHKDACQDDIDLRIELVARYYKVPEKDIKVQFKDEELAGTSKVVELQLRDDLKEKIKTVRFQN